MEYIISPIWTLMDLFAITLFANAFMQKNPNQKRRIISFLLIWVLGSTCINLGVAGAAKVAINIGMTFGLLAIHYLDTWPRRLLCTVILWISLGIIDTAVLYGFCAVLQISYEEFVWQKLLYVTVATFAKLFEIFLAYILWRIRKRIAFQQIDRRWLLLTVLFPITSLIMAVIVFASFRDSDDFSIGAVIFTCVLAASNIAILDLIRIMEVRSQKEVQILLMNQQMQIQTQNIQALEKSYRAQRTASHEFMHQMQTISGLLEDNQLQAARDYVLDIQKTHSSRTLAVNTHHPILDAVFNHKYQLACEQGIDMQFLVNDLSKINIGTDELVIVFSNLLDNALEACMRKADNRRIECRIEADMHLFISIRNTSLPVKIINNRIETSKMPKSDHGFGLPNICRILDSLEAEYAFNYSDDWFHFVAEIPLSNK